jgi:CheY-like chemotaxis protein
VASPAVSRVGEARLAGAIARLLRWEAQLLARPAHDAASRSAALRGLEWAADFARALDAEPCAAWLDALRERANERPGHTPEAWGVLGAPACADVAQALEDEQTLRPLSADARGWRTMAAAVRTYEEPPPPPDPPDPSAPAGQAGDVDAPAISDAGEIDLPHPFLDLELTDEDLDTLALELEIPDAPGGLVPEAVWVAGDPALREDLERALEAWCGDRTIAVETRGGCVELSGTRPSEHPAEGVLSMDALEALRQLHLAAGAIPAPLLVADPVGGVVEWSLRLPARDAERHLFAEAEGRRLALPWHAVVTCGLGDQGQSHVVLGRGLERIALVLDWLHGLGRGQTREGADPAAEPVFDTPVLTGLPRLLEFEDGGTFLEVAVRPLEVAVAEPVAAPDAAEPREAAETPAPVHEEPVQDAAPPADNPERSAPRVRNALVADDSFTARVFLSRLLAMRGIEVDEAEDGPHALAFLAGRSYDLVFFDAGMPGGGALDLAESMEAGVRASTVVLVRDDGERAAAQAAGFAGVLFKPFAEDEVAAALVALAGESRPGA